MIIVRIAAVGLFWYGLFTSDFSLWIWALILWEIGSKFSGSIIVWLSGLGR